jgi:hypothetical protein
LQHAGALAQAQSAALATDAQQLVAGTAAAEQQASDLAKAVKRSVRAMGEAFAKAG